MALTDTEIKRAKPADEPYRMVGMGVWTGQPSSSADFKRSSEFGQTFAVEIEIDQGEAGAEPVAILCDSPITQLLSWQLGYAATWELRTFAPFGMYPD
ncbi:MAG: hypothetical protein ABI286_04190 [Edaphobacter sp.]